MLYFPVSCVFAYTPVSVDGLPPPYLNLSRIGDQYNISLQTASYDGQQFLAQMGLPREQLVELRAALDAELALTSEKSVETVESKQLKDLNDYVLALTPRVSTLESQLKEKSEKLAVLTSKIDVLEAIFRVQSLQPIMPQPFYVIGCHLVGDKP